MVARSDRGCVAIVIVGRHLKVYDAPGVELMVAVAGDDDRLPVVESTIHHTGARMSDLTMDQILDALDQSHQRATYGAVAALLGTPPRTLMQGRERDRRHSWVVSRKNGEPTGYKPDELHPALHERTDVLSTKEELAAWLQSALVVVKSRQPTSRATRTIRIGVASSCPAPG